MSEFISYRRVNTILRHPDADKLEVVKVGGFTVCHPKGTLKEGDMVCHVPTDICIDPEKAIMLGVANYLKKCTYQGGKSVNCWVRAARLRGIPSQGFIIENCKIPEEYLDEYFGVWKYQPQPADRGDAEFHSHPQFPKYTKIKRLQYSPDAWVENLPVRITEKLHGQNIRLGLVEVDNEWRFMVGSNNVILKDTSRLWEHLDERVMDLLNCLCDESKPVVIYAERFGPGVQDLHYGLDTPEIRVFDIMVDGKYQAWDLVQQWCESFKLEPVPSLFTGGFSWDDVDMFTSGTSIIGGGIREGVVVTPLVDTHSSVLAARLIGKSISCDYEARRGGTEFS